MVAPYQQRVIVEKQDLDARMAGLMTFITAGETFNNLDMAERDRLRRQCRIMLEYSEVLDHRIEAFQPVAT